MLNITKIAFLWSLGIRCAFVLLGFAAFTLLDPARATPEILSGRAIAEAFGMVLASTTIAVMVAAFFYFPKKNQWWEKRGIMAAIITVLAVNFLSMIGGFTG